MQELNQDYWDLRYKNNNTPWDIGHASPAITDYLLKYNLQGKKILIPGAGNAYEAFWLAQNSGADITVLDISPTVIDVLRERVEQLNLTIRLIQGDFFSHVGQYDLIIEQTFFCALDPELRESYAKRMSELLMPDGILCGLLFNVQFDREGPPFGGFEQDYSRLFKGFFDDVKIYPTPLSIAPRRGTEVFIEIRLPKFKSNLVKNFS